MNRDGLWGWRFWRERLHWLLIGLIFAMFGAMFGVHLVMRWMPPREAVPLAGIDLPVYWYGIIIVGGIALGGYVVSRLALDRAEAMFVERVPTAVQSIPLTTLNLPPEILSILSKRSHLLGPILFQWGIDAQALGLNQAGRKVFYERVTAVSGVNAAWLDDPPWRVWSPELVWSGLIWCMVLGVIGARLYHVMTPSPSMAALGINSPADYFRHPALLFNLRNGGLGIYGGIAGGALALALFTWRNRLPGLAWADLSTIGLALGQAIGRWGNFFNQELYGRPTTVPWAIYIEPVHRLPAYAAFETFHPAFLYESLWSLLTFGVLLTLTRRYARQLRTGELTAVYLIFYAVGRSLLELVRLDSRTVSVGGVETNLAVATLVSIIVAVAMVGWVLVRRWRVNGRS